MLLNIQTYYIILFYTKRLKIRFLMKFIIIKWIILSTYYKYFSQYKNQSEILTKKKLYS